MERPQLDDDTLLSAYLDGELREDEASQVTERLAREPALMRRLEALKSADDAAREAFASIDERPLPAAVLEMLGAEKSEATSNVLSFPSHHARKFAQLPVALAASVALVAGFLVNDALRDAPGDPLGIDAAGIVADGSDLHELLELGTSAESRQLAGGLSGEVVLTFEDKAGDYCRHMMLVRGDQGIQGVACRREGDWALEALSFGDAPAAGGPFRQASGAVPVAIDSAIDALIGQRDPLDADEEIALISEGWISNDD